jgi:chemotaxis protein methyltransferase CheR
MSTTLELSSFEAVRQIVLADAGIVLEPGKEYLVESRLAPIVRKEGLASIEVLVQSARSKTSELRRKIVDAMTINETTFFRDTDPFEYLAGTVLPTLIEARKVSRQLRIWYAAASTGQEPYSVSMQMREQFPVLESWRVVQLATDLSRPALERAKAGRYSQVEINRGLPAKLLVKYFDRHGLEWEIKDHIRRMVSFQEMNLNGVWPAMGTFDIVFLRNVMIYFDLEAKKRILGNIHRMLAPDGYLFLGAAETTMNLDDRFKRSDKGRAGCYVRT